MSDKKKRGRGRPVVFKGNVKKHIVGLLRKHGATKTRAILSAVDGELASLRSEKTVPQPLSISMPTLIKYASQAGVKMQRGRPKKVA
jgi:hypothetical protein